MCCCDGSKWPPTSAIGAARYERSGDRTTQRNGHRTKTLATKAGDLELKISKLRDGVFYPSLLERRRRIDWALFGVVIEAYVHGATRKVDDLVVALGVDSGISKSEVSRICGEPDEELAGFRDRRLDHVEFPYVFLDVTYLKGRVAHEVVSRAVVVATGESMDGGREVLGCAVGDSENASFWTEFVRSLRARGWKGVRLVIALQHLGSKRPSKRSWSAPPGKGAESIHRTPPGPHAGRSLAEGEQRSPLAFVPKTCSNPRFRRRLENFRCVSSGLHMFVFSSSSSRRSPDPVSPGLFPKRSPQRLLTVAASGGLGSPPARRARRATLHHWHSTVCAGGFYVTITLLSGHTNWYFVGSPNGIRTRVSTLRGRTALSSSSPGVTFSLVRLGSRSGK